MMLERLHVCVFPVILVVLCCIVPVENQLLSDSTCPKITPQDLNCSNNEVYHIVRDPRSDRYIEGCFISLTVPPGYATILDTNTGHLNTEACDEGTFQPDHYRSNTQCACKETKEPCDKTGQLIASNGNTTHDRTCRCDFGRGFMFSRKNSDKCVCQSSSEDCTCIKKECQTGYRLSPDYQCVPENLYSTTNYTCKDYISEESTTESVPARDTSASLESTRESVPDNNASIPERMPTGKLPWHVMCVVVVFCALICSKKKCRPGRNGSATTNNEGTICMFIQRHRPCRNGPAPTNNEGKLYVAVQETENDAVIGMSAHLEVDEPAPDEVTNNNQRQHTAI